MKRLFVYIIKLYKRIISPYLPPACRFYPSCSEYAVLTLQKHGLGKSLFLIIWRIIRCNPFCAGGYDPVK